MSRNITERTRGVVLNAAARERVFRAMKGEFDAERRTVANLADKLGISERVVTKLRTGDPVDRRIVESVFVALEMGRPRDEDFEERRSTAVDSGGSPVEFASVAYFDDVKVYAGDVVFLDEDFNDYDHGRVHLTRKGLRTLEMYFSGMGGYVTHEAHAPNSGPACWKSVSLPNWSRQDMIPITPNDVPRGVPLVCEVSLKLPDPRVSALVGLTRPYMRDDCHYQSHIAVVNVGEHGVQFLTSYTGWPMLLAGSQIVRDRWHRVVLSACVESRTMDVSFDGERIAEGVPMGRSTDGDYEFTQFAIGRDNYKYLADAPVAT